MPVHFTFEVHTPYRPFFSGRVESISLMLSDGEIGVYAGHSPFSAPALSCILRIKDDKGELRHAFITDGILEVKEHKTVLMVDTAEWPEEIDRERAMASRKKAEENLEIALLKFETDKANSKIRRAEIRLKTSELRKQGSPR
ncbi:MAG: ATP synthase F1 subunit epsilon [Treponema sp.]|nr:ATP synthase F1 subunit epsilon [Treponema sp.]